MFSGNLTGKTDRRSAWHSISGFCLALPNCHLSIVGDPGVPWTKCCVYDPCSNVAPSRTGQTGLKAYPKARHTGGSNREGDHPHR